MRIYYDSVDDELVIRFRKSNGTVSFEFPKTPHVRYLVDLRSGELAGAVVERWSNLSNDGEYIDLDKILSVTTSASFKKSVAKLQRPISC